MMKLVQGNRDQEAPKIAAMLRLETAFAGAAEEAAACRLNHILGVQTSRQSLGDPAARQGNQPFPIQLKQIVRGLLVAFPPAL